MALDTEFVRERTFFQKLGLVQVAVDDADWLIDPLAVRDLQPLVELLRAPAVVKVVHAASEDIEVLHHTLGTEPRPLFDTQVGAALAGGAAAQGYARLVAAELGVELHKGETRTDWLRRPLTQGQIEYAAEDVVHLLPLYRLLSRRLEEQGRLAWALEDSAALADPARFAEAPERAYLRLRAAGRLGRRQLGALRALAAWRDTEARRRDIPRRFLLRDELLLALAARQPKTLRELERLPSYDPRQGARDAGTWLEILERAAGLPDARPAARDLAPARRRAARGARRAAAGEGASQGGGAGHRGRGAGREACARPPAALGGRGRPPRAAAGALGMAARSNWRGAAAGGRAVVSGRGARSVVVAALTNWAATEGRPYRCSTVLGAAVPGRPRLAAAVSGRLNPRTCSRCGAR